MTPEEIKAAIARAGTTQTAIASHLDVRVQSIGRVIKGTMRSAKIEAELAKLTGKPLHASQAKPGRPKSTWNGQHTEASA